MKSRLTVFLLTFSILTALALPLSAFMPTAEDAGLYDGIIRLHVLANSDSDEDQALKLKVRDEVLEKASELLSGVTDRGEAEALLTENLAALRSAAADIIAENGYAYSVDVTLTEEDYPTREYGNFALPAGSYTSLRVLIGDAEGKNWWCMLFPTLCIGTEKEAPAAVIDESECIEAGLTPSQVKIITGSSPTVKVKFRVLEFIGGMFS